MTGLDLAAALIVLRDYAAAIIDERENGGTVQDADYLVRLVDCVIDVRVGAA